MKTRLHCIAPAALAWALIGWSVLPAPSAARAEDRPSTRSSARQPVQRSGNKTGLSIGRLIAHKAAAQQSEPQPAKPAAREGITVEKLWDRWKSGGGSPKSKATPRSQESPEQDANRPQSQSRPPEEQLEAPQPAPAEGEFPVFRAGPPPQVPQPQAAAAPIQAPLPIAVPRPKAPPAHVPVPAVVPMPAAAPAEAPTSVMTRYETPVLADFPAAKAFLGHSAQAAAPAPSEIRVRSTSGYLANEVRFGIVLRAPSRGASLDPTADILGEVQKSLPGSTLSSVDPQTVESFDRTFSDDDSSPRPQVVQVRAEDTSRFRTMAPAPSAEISGRPAKLLPGAAANVASAASSAALQQALRRYGKSADARQPAPQEKFDTQYETPEPVVQEPQMLEPQPEPELQPVPEPEVQTPDDDASQRSVLLGGSKPLAIDRPGQPKSQGIRLKGLSKAVERSNSAGAVAGIDRTNRTIRVVFSKGPPPAVGEKLQVFQKVLFHRHLLGEFQVVGVQGNTVIARPTEKIDLESIVNGDEVAAIN